MQNRIFLSVVIPAYNEEKKLPKTLNEIDKYLRNQNYPSAGLGQASYEIIVVNDGSKDKTAEAVKDLTPVIKNLKLIDNKENRGKGFVVRQGMLAAEGEYRLFTDADNSTSINQIEKMWPYFEEAYDIVIGSRGVKGAEILVSQFWIRRRLGNIFNLLAQVIIGLWGVWDTQCGFKAFRAGAAKDIFPKCTIDGWGFDPEALIIGKKMGHKFKEIPVVWENNSVSKLKFKGMAKTLIDLLKIKWNLIIKKYDKQKDKISVRIAF